jgi:hypothetical protein
MKKSIILALLISTSLFFTACTKTPFKKEQPLKGTALVYVYVMADNGINDTDRIPYYEVKINKKSTDGKIYPQEHLKYNLDADNVTISVVRNDVEKRTIDLNLKRGEIYYLRVVGFSDRFLGYNYEQIEPEIALQEIKDTVYAIREDSEALDILVTKESEAKASHQTESKKSKTQQIKDAHQLKQDGIINEAEFLKLKTEILDAK